MCCFYRVIEPVQPELRPKGMGLGANSLVNASKTAVPVDKNGKELALVKGAFAKIIAGSHKHNYCEVRINCNLKIFDTNYV